MKRRECRHYLARGALLWGPLYATGISGIACTAAPGISGDPSSCLEVIMHSALICPSVGAAGGWVRWYLARGHEPACGRGVKAAENRRHRFHSGRKAAHRKAA